jgi:pre-mRNA-processing factor 19
VNSGQLEATLTAHTKKVTDVAFHPTADLVITCSADKTVKLWSCEGKKVALAHTLTGHDGVVTECSIHPTGSYLGTSSDDGSWACYDLSTAALLKRVQTNEATSFQFHPDGAIFGTGHSDSMIRIWDAASASNVATFEGHSKGISSLCFSENGYHLISGSADGLVKFWDLRKLKSVLDLSFKGSVHTVHLEFNGQHLAVAAGNQIHVYKESGKKNWDVVKTFSDHTAAVTDVKIAPGVAFMASTSIDRSLKIYA